MKLPRGRPSVINLLAAMSLAFVLASCSSTGSDASRLLLEAPDHTVAAGSSRVVATVELEREGGDAAPRIHTEGIFSYAQQLGVFTFDMAAFGLPGAGQAEMIVAGSRMYLKIPDRPVKGRPWLRIDLSEAGTAEAASFGQLLRSDPTAGLHYLRGVEGEARRVGSERLRGKATTVYATTIDLEKITDTLPQGPLPELPSGEKTLAARVWLDEQGRMRKLVYRVDLDAEGASAGGLSGTLVVTQELYDFGVDVDVDEPEDGKFVDVAELSPADLAPQQDATRSRDDGA